MSNAETCKYNAQSRMSEAKTKGQNAKCCMRKNECTFHLTWRSNSKTWLLLMKSWMSKAKTWMLHRNRSWMLNAKKMNRECKLKWQTCTKCRTDCVKYNVKWNIEFWRKWSAIKDSQVFFERTNHIHEFEGCFLKGQISSNCSKLSTVA